MPLLFLWSRRILTAEFWRMVSRMTSEERMSLICWVTTIALTRNLRLVFHRPARYGAIVLLAMAFHASSMASTLKAFSLRIFTSKAFMMQRMQME